MLASVAGVAIQGVAAAQTNSSTVASTSTSFTLTGGQAFTNTAAGSVTLSAGASAGSAAILAVTGTTPSLTNAGVINAAAANGIAVHVTSGGSVTSVTNTGTITGNTAGASAIVVDGTNGVSTIGTLTNSGLIQTTGAAAILVDTGGSIGLLANQAGGTIAATGSVAIQVNGSVGAIANAGTILSTGSNAVQVNGSVGTISNSGGLIQSVLASAVQVNGSVGTITNASGASIGSTGPTAIGIASSGTVGTLVNAGGIQTTGTGGAALSVAGRLTGLTNAATGAIFSNGGSSQALAVLGTGTIGSLVNSGTISAPNGTGITVASGGSIAGGITNAAGGVIRGSTLAIDNSGNANALAIFNAGSVIGGISFGTGADSLAITGSGTVTGAISGLAGAGQSVTFTPTGLYTLGAPITAVDTISVNSGTLALAALQSTSTPISGGSLFSIGSGGIVAFASGTVAVGRFTNSGLLNVGTGTPTISGNYTQTGSGTLALDFTPTAVGGITITGTATLGGALAVNVASNTTNAQYGQTFAAITAGSIVQQGMTVASSSPFLTFTTQYAGGVLDLTAVHPTTSQALSIVTTQVNNILGNVGSGGDTGSGDGLSGFALQEVQTLRTALTGLLGALAVSGDTTDYYRIMGVLQSLSPTQQAEVLERLQPSQILSTIGMLSSSVSGGGGSTYTISNLLTSRRSSGETGMAAGDEVGRGWAAWAQPYGSFLTQDTNQGVSGYQVNTYGATFGADTQVTPTIRLGLALGLGNSDVSYNGAMAGNTASVFNLQLSGYGTWSSNHWFVDGILGGGFNWYTAHENLGAFGSTRSSSFNGTQFMARVNAGYDWITPNKMVLTPSIGLQESHINTDGYTTSGAGVLNLHVNSNSMDVVQSRLGARLSYPIKGYGTYTLTPEVHAYYLHNFGSGQISTVAAFTGGGPAFTVSTPTTDRNLFDIGVGLTITQVGPFTLNGAYDYTGGATSHDHLIYLRLKTEF